MGRRNESNRLAHKKKVDNKKRKEQEAKNSLNEKRKAILNKINKDKNDESKLHI